MMWTSPAMLRNYGVWALCLPVWFASLGMALRTADIKAEIAREEAECNDAPEFVPYHDGMTLCPGQTAIIVIQTAPSDEGTYVGGGRVPRMWIPQRH